MDSMSYSTFRAHLASTLDKVNKACRVSLVNPSGCSCSRTDSLLGDNLVWPRYALLRAAAAPRRAPDGAVGLRHRPTQMA